MRGKVRDKRASSRKDFSSRESSERRRPYKRDTRATNWLGQNADEDFNLDLDLDGETEAIEGDEAIQIQLPQKKM